MARKNGFENSAYLGQMHNQKPEMLTVRTICNTLKKQKRKKQSKNSPVHLAHLRDGIGGESFKNISTIYFKGKKLKWS